jgi:glutamate--cysteine ligase
MRDFFERLGEPGSLASGVMALTLSTQATFDYSSEADFSEKLRMQVLASPVVAALFVNSPIEGGQLSGALSRRMQYWFKIDPRRCGVLPFGLKEAITIDDVVNWALQMPMIYRVKEGRYTAGPNRPFATLLRDGFGDGTMPALSDWASHLSQLWPHVRVRQALEVRAADGPTYDSVFALPAMWTGLTYHAPSRVAAWELLRHRTQAQLETAMQEIAVKGLRAMLGPDSVHDIGKELLNLSRDGLRARVQSGLEPEEVLSYLEPLEEVIISGRTSAERCIDRWITEFRTSPKRYVDAYQIRID